MMPKISLKIILGILLVLSAAVIAILYHLRGPGQPAETSLPAQAISERSEEYAVYSAILNEMFVQRGAKFLVIQKQTTFYSNPNYLKQTTIEERVLEMKGSYPTVSEEAVRDYVGKSETPSSLEPNFDLPVEFIFIDEAEIRRENSGSRMDPYYEDAISRGGGVIRLSSVGFNKDNTEAFAYVELIYCPLCGQGDKVLLKKHSGVWKIEEKFSSWIS